MDTRIEPGSGTRDTSARPAAGAPRFLYRVRPTREKWEVVIGEAGPRFVYGSRQEAIDVASGAASLHWRTRHEPSGVVVVDAGGAAHTVAVHGA